MHKIKFNIFLIGALFILFSFNVTIGLYVLDFMPYFIGTMLILASLSAYNNHNPKLLKIKKYFKMLTIWFIVTYILELLYRDTVDYNMGLFLYNFFAQCILNYTIYLVIELVSIFESDSNSELVSNKMKKYWKISVGVFLVTSVVYFVNLYILPETTTTLNIAILVAALDVLVSIVVNIVLAVLLFKYVKSE